MMSPTLVLGPGGRPELVLGSGGSKRIRTAVLPVLTAVVEGERPVEEAVRAPRLHWDTDHVELEPGWPADVVDALGPSGAGVPCSPVYTVDQLLTHPQLVARGMIQRLAHPTLGELVVPGVVPKLSETPGEIRSYGPELGQHNDDVYGGLLGLSAEERRRLRDVKAI